MNAVTRPGQRGVSAGPSPGASPPVELFEAAAFRAVTLALTDQQLIQPHIVGEWLDSLPYERQSRLVVGLYYAGMISHETGCEFVPHLDVERR